MWWAETTQAHGHIKIKSGGQMQELIRHTRPEKGRDSHWTHKPRMQHRNWRTVLHQPINSCLIQASRTNRQRTHNFSLELLLCSEPCCWYNLVNHHWPIHLLAHLDLNQLSPTPTDFCLLSLQATVSLLSILTLSKPDLYSNSFFSVAGFPLSHQRRPPFAFSQITNKREIIWQVAVI